MSINWNFIILLQILQLNLALPQNSREKEIKELETQKTVLFQQINEAIDDSITYLKKSNTTDALLGISYIKDLKKQIKELNGTESIDNVNYENEGISKDDKSGLENRRSLKKTDVEKKESNATVALERRSILKDIADADKKKSQVELEYFEAMKDKSKKWRQRYEARLSVQKRLDAWIEQREKEKQKIKEGKQKRMLFKEKCPRHGVANNKKSGKKKAKRGKKRKNGKSYPCCRKCCKKSYMGCLRKK